MWRSATLCILLMASHSLAQTNPSSMEPVSCEQEADCLAKLPDKTRREGNVLTLTLDNGETKIFKTDRQACEDDDVENCISFELRAYRPAQNVYVIGWTLYEGVGAGLVSTKTGDVLALPDTPHFSPSGQRFVAIHNDPHDAPEFHIGIWSLEAGNAKQEFRYTTPESAAPEFWDVLSWEGDAKIRLEVRGYDDMSMSGYQTDAVLEERGWVLNWPQPRGK